MAVSPPTNEAFLREVDEELRRQEMLDFWKRYGRRLVGAVIGGLAVFAAVLIWQNRQQQAAVAQSAQFSKLFDQIATGQIAAAEAPLKQLTTSDLPVYRALAIFVEADLLLRNLDTRQPDRTAAKLREAAGKFARVAQDRAVPQPLRDLALVRQISADYDRLAPGAVIDRLKPLAVAGNPWLGSAGEMVAIAYLRLNRPAEAKALLKLIAAGDDVPPAMRQRASQLALAIGGDRAVVNKDTQAR